MGFMVGIWLKNKIPNLALLIESKGSHNNSIIRIYLKPVYKISVLSPRGQK